MSRISTGGNASQELIYGKVLPGVAALTDMAEIHTSVVDLREAELNAKLVCIMCDLSVPMNSNS